MKSIWLNKKENKNLIVFFSGWGSEETIFQKLGCENYDVIMFYDYRNFDINMPDFSAYENKYIIAWSLGVYVVNRFFEKNDDLKKIIAINGTQKPIDDNYGIYEKIYNLTVDNFNDVSCKKFMSKISTNEIFKNYKPRTTEELRDELISIKNLKIDNFLKFDRAYVSLNDRIIPTKNQIAYWKAVETTITELDAPHYIFDMFEKWSEIL